MLGRVGKTIYFCKKLLSMDILRFFSKHILSAIVHILNTFVRFEMQPKFVGTYLILDPPKKMKKKLKQLINYERGYIKLQRGYHGCAWQKLDSDI